MTLKHLFPVLLILILALGAKAQNRIDSLLRQIEDSAGTVRVGLVLAGGGAKGLAHIGVIKVLEEEGIRVDYVGGTSMGGLIGGLYALGNSAQDLTDIVHKLDWNKLLNDKVNRQDLTVDEKATLSTYIMTFPLKGWKPNLPQGLRKGMLIQNELTLLSYQSEQIDDFAMLPLPFYCIAADIENGEEVILDKGSLPVALRSTMSIPSIFEPVQLGNHLLVDGGIVNNFPVDVMRSKGMNFIIGIDVGADLYRREEIKSVLEIMDQATSFYGRRKLEDNKKITDLYIRPDISGLNTLDFNKTDDIIARGEAAAREHIEEIRALARYLKSHQKTTKQIHKIHQDSIFLDKINIIGVNKPFDLIIRKRLNLKIPKSYSIESINNAVNRVYYSGYFDKVSYELTHHSRSYTLKVFAEEKSNDLFNAGVHYDDNVGAEMIININLINFLMLGTKTDLSFILGPNPGYQLSYRSDRNKWFGYGLRLSNITREIYAYNNNFSSTTSSYYLNFSKADLLIFSNLSAFGRIAAGLEFEYSSLKSDISILPSMDYSNPYLNLFIHYTLDSYDDANYPSKGYRTRANAQYCSLYGESSMAFITLSMESTGSLGPLAFTPGIDFGASFNNTRPYFNSFIIGGQGDNFIHNMLPFAGALYTSYIKDNALIFRLKMRYQFLKKHYLFVKGNAGLWNDELNKLFQSNIIYGAVVGYSFNSLIGPLEISWGASNQGPYSSSFLSLGYWF